MLAAAPAAFATEVPPPPADGGAAGAAGPVPVHTVVVGGTPGWQIALLAVGAAVLAAAAAVLVDRSLRARRAAPGSAGAPPAEGHRAGRPADGPRLRPGALSPPLSRPPASAVFTMASSACAVNGFWMNGPAGSAARTSGV